MSSTNLALIFDMNGVIVDDGLFHKKAFFELCDNYSINLTDDIFDEFVSGRRNEDIFKYLFGDISSQKINSLSEEKEVLYRQLYQDFKKPLDGLVNFLDLVSSKNIPIGLATGAPVENRSYILDDLNLRRYFQVVVGPKHISQGKPDPEIFLKVAHDLGVEPSKCIGFEDSFSGFKAIKSANMYCVGLATTYSRSKIKSFCDLVISDFNDSSLEKLLRK